MENSLRTFNQGSEFGLAVVGPWTMVLASVFLFQEPDFPDPYTPRRWDPVIMRQDFEKWVGLFSLFIWGQVCSAIENFELKRISFEKLVRHPSYTGHRTLLTEAWEYKNASETFHHLKVPKKFRIFEKQKGWNFYLSTSYFHQFFVHQHIYQEESLIRYEINIFDCLMHAISTLPKMASEGHFYWTGWFLENSI